MEKLRVEKNENEKELNKVKYDLHNVQEKCNILKNDKELLEKKYIMEINENKQFKENEKKYEERSMQYYLSLEENKNKLVKIYKYI